MKVLVCGSRHWVEPGPIERELRKLPPSTTLIHGAGRGADNIAGAIGKKLGFTVRSYPADWLKDGEYAAGPIRNGFMLKQEHPYQDGVYIDLGLAFHKDPLLGKGTKNMVARLLEALPVIRVERFQR